MQTKYLRFISVSVLMLNSTAALALPFNSFDPYSMAMGGTGVASSDPSTAPFFNPALLTAFDPKWNFDLEIPIIGGRLYDPSNMRANLPLLGDNVNLLTTSVTPLTSSATSLTGSTTALTNSITSLTTAVGGTIDATTLSSLSTNLATIKTNLNTVSGNVTSVSSNSTTVQTNLNKVNQSLLALNNQPLQGEFGAAAVIGIPGKDFGFALYAQAFGAMGGTLEYADAPTITTISGAISATATALTSSSAAISTTSTAQTALATAITALTTANTNCNVTPVASCAADITAATTALNAANTALSAASTTLSTNAGTVSTQSTLVSNNNTVLSKIHLRGVLITEKGLSISHGFVINDREWSLGITPKLIQLKLFDALLSANSGSTSGATGSDYLAEYSAWNFDVGAAKTYPNGWRTGVVIKNVVPLSFDFKNAPTPGATPVANGSTLKLNPLVRVGAAHETDWSTAAFDLDLTQNDPAGLENKTQYVALGGELNALDWASVRAGYRMDLVSSRKLLSLGFGLRYFDFALAASPDIFSDPANVREFGASLRFGLVF